MGIFCCLLVHLFGQDPLIMRALFILSYVRTGGLLHSVSPVRYVGKSRYLTLETLSQHPVHAVSGNKGYHIP